MPKWCNCTCRNGITLNEIVPLNGYWRPHPWSKIFSNCEEAYSGTDALIKAKDRCNKLENVWNKTYLQWMRCEKNIQTFDDSDVQCKLGYRGNLCASCSNDYVKQGEDCVFCEGGSDVKQAAGVLFFLCVFIFIVMVYILYHVKDSERAKGSKYFGQMKIFIMFLQIVSAMPYSLASVQWPANFKLLAINLGFVNFEFLKLLDISSCKLSLHPLNRFAMHISFVPLLIFTLSAAYISTNFLDGIGK